MTLGRGVEIDQITIRVLDNGIMLPPKSVPGFFDYVKSCFIELGANGVDFIWAVELDSEAGMVAGFRGRAHDAFDNGFFVDHQPG